MIQSAADTAQAPARRRARAGGPDRGLTLVEIGELVEQFPQLDWSPVIEAAAREERARAAVR